MSKSCILGKGYIGTLLKDVLPDFLTTTRSQKGDIYFDFYDKSSWKNLPSMDKVIITFPLENLSLAQEFFKQHLSQCSIIFLYGTTSIYKNKVGILDENSLLDKQHSRYTTEQYLLKEGVNILALSGICGENRQPRNWLLDGRIKNGEKVVNLIHCSDIVTITLRLLGSKLRGERVNITAGSYIWYDIAQELKVRINFSQFVKNERIISNMKLLKILPEYKFICPYKG